MSIDARKKVSADHFEAITTRLVGSQHQAGSFERFLDDHYQEALRSARPLGKLKGHPIVFTTWVSQCTAPGALWVGEAARVTHNATGEGISQAMQSGVFAAEAVAAVVRGERSERSAWARYVWRHRRRFTAGFAAGYVVRAMVASSGLDLLARAYGSAWGQRLIERVVGSALTGTTSQEAPEAYQQPPRGDFMAPSERL